jgi:citrate lyase synthetase
MKRIVWLLGAWFVVSSTGTPRYYCQESGDVMESQTTGKEYCEDMAEALNVAHEWRQPKSTEKPDPQSNELQEEHNEYEHNR